MMSLIGAWVGLMGFQAWMIHSPTRKKKLAIIDAVGRGDLDGVQQIASKGMSLNFNYWSHVSWRWIGSPLSAAFGKKDASIANFLIANGASVSPNSPGNDTLLLQAVKSGDLERVDLALKAGYDIHFQPRNCSKPLAAAIHRRSIPMARFLLSKGAAKEEVGYCRWHTMNSETILFIHEIGIEVPSDVLTAVRDHKWERPTPKENV